MERLRPKKALGQNFLTDRHVLGRIVAAVAIGPDEAVLEVGPGRGALTALLAEQAGKVVAVELDRQLVPLLRERFAGQRNVEVVEADILSVDLPQLLGERSSAPWRVAANLPYNISTPVLFRFLDDRALFSRLVLMFQREVGERLLAGPGSKAYGALSVLFHLHFDIERVINVRPGAFHPVPKVDSVVLGFTPLGGPRLPVGDEAFFRRVVKAAFSQRRKTLWNCLRAAGIAASDEGLLAALQEAGIDGARRGETLSLGEFAGLALSLATRGMAKPP
jgi:16S rRNA (adenine1518-N6/adenine1519-N6)-dimethyltransferase